MQTITIAIAAAVVIGAPWFWIAIASSHDHPAHWTADFPRSIFHGFLVDFFTVIGLCLFLHTSKELQRRIAITDDDAEVVFLDRMRHSLSLLTQTLFFLALMLSVA